MMTECWFLGWTVPLMWMCLRECWKQWQDRLFSAPFRKKRKCRLWIPHTGPWGPSPASATRCSGFSQHALGGCCCLHMHTGASAFGSHKPDLHTHTLRFESVWVYHLLQSAVWLVETVYPWWSVAGSGAAPGSWWEARLCPAASARWRLETTAYERAAGVRRRASWVPSVSPCEPSVCAVAGVVFVFPTDVTEKKAFQYVLWKHVCTLQLHQINVCNKI